MSPDAQASAAMSFTSPELANRVAGVPSNGKMTDATPLLGLRIRLKRPIDVPCGACGETIVVIGKSTGSHAASLHCASCERHRGWLPKALTEFLIEMIHLFGPPSDGIMIRKPRICASKCSRALGCSRGRNVRTPDPGTKRRLT
jgi:hypothetical protein